MRGFLVVRSPFLADAVGVLDEMDIACRTSELKGPMK
jgi:hypothetical protein